MVARAPLSMRPAGLHDGFGWCALHQEAWRPGVRRTCPKCASLPSMPTRAGAFQWSDPVTIESCAVLARKAGA